MSRPGRARRGVESGPGHGGLKFAAWGSRLRALGAGGCVPELHRGIKGLRLLRAALVAVIFALMLSATASAALSRGDRVVVRDRHSKFDGATGQVVRGTGVRRVLVRLDGRSSKKSRRSFARRSLRLRRPAFKMSPAYPQVGQPVTFTTARCA